jgi:predicted ribosome quality control (RQC) complex YloA/Tae2 family protein
MSVDWRNFVVIFVVGIILISFAAAIPLYPQSVISELQNNLSSGALSQFETYAQQGSLTWWNLAQKNTYEPLSSIFNSAGLLMLVLSVIYACFALLYNLRQSKFKKEKDSSNAEVDKKETSDTSFSEAEKAQSPVESVPKDAEVVLDERYVDYEHKLPSIEKRLEEEEPKEEYSERKHRYEKPSSLWYIVPFLFGIIGGIIGYVGTKSEDSDLANNLLIFGILWSIVLYIAYWLLISSLY